MFSVSFLAEHSSLEPRIGNGAADREVIDHLSRESAGIPARRVVSFPRRGEVYLVNFHPTLGAEIKKTRPALILQNDIGNRYSPLTIVAAIISRYEERLYPHQVLVTAPEGGVRVNSLALLNQIRSVDKRRLVKRLGRLTPDTMRRVDRALQISVGLVPL